LLNKKYAACDALLTKIDIIPFEGATDGRGLYHEAKLMQAVDAMKKKQYKTALNFIKAAKIWPVNLGVGKPYQQDIDERLEDWLTYLCYTKQNNTALAQQALQKLIAFTPKIDNTVRNFLPANNLISAWAYDALQNHAAAEQLLNQWQQKEPSNAIFNWCKTQYETPGKVVNDNIKNESVRIINALLQLP
jgi:tetratricopeptide (TPR) repeat protein